MCNILFFTEEVDFVFSNTTKTTTWLKNVIRREGGVLSHLNFIFCSDHYLHAKNLQYLRHDTWTDVLAFSHAENTNTVEGDIYISVDRIRANAKSWKQSFIQELHTVMVHGVLHLLGYEDKTTTGRAQMRLREAQYVTEMAANARQV